jgi:hypothetical protein
MRIRIRIRAKMSWIHNSGSNCRNISLAAVVQRQLLCGYLALPSYISLVEWDFPDIILPYLGPGKLLLQFPLLRNDIFRRNSGAWRKLIHVENLKSKTLQ